MKCQLHQNYRVVILDLNMPIAMGNEVASFVRRKEAELMVAKPHYLVASSSLSEKNIEDLK